MKAKSRPRFDVEVLRERAGTKAFARGEAHCAGGEVEILGIDPRPVLAQVAGTEDYRVELTGQAKDVSGVCSCPAYGDLGLCKHLVATNRQIMSSMSSRSRRASSASAIS